MSAAAALLPVKRQRKQHTATAKPATTATAPVTSSLSTAAAAAITAASLGRPDEFVSRKRGGGERSKGTAASLAATQEEHPAVVPHLHGRGQRHPADAAVTGTAALLGAALAVERKGGWGRKQQRERLRGQGFLQALARSTADLESA